MSWRENFREDNRVLFEICGGWCWKFYLCTALLTFVFQARLRLEGCDGFLLCSWSLTKGVMWGLLWPFYWINYATDFVLFHPFQLPKS
jgi:hypothetical protein